ncbi:MAG: M2 family metallopeptidase [Acidobacteriota bacterium]
MPKSISTRWLLSLMVMVLFLAVAAGSQKPSTAKSSSANSEIRENAQKFIDDYTQQWNQLRREYVLADWNSNTKIVEGDNTNAKATTAALEKLSAFTGSKSNIETVTKFLKQKAQLSELQIRQLQNILFLAGENPETAGEVVKQRIAAETAQTEKLYGFDFKLDGQSITANKIDELLRTSQNLEEREKVWSSSKEVGKVLKDGLANLQQLRNATVKPLGYKSFYSYQASEYGLTAEEMMKLMEDIRRQLWPLYRELHTYTRYELAKRYNRPVPDLLPAHWLPNRWGQYWDSIVEVPGLNIDAALKDRSPEWVVKQAEQFYISLGWQPLPQSFWEKSSLYPLPPNTPYKKNNHASAWHMDNEQDVRALMSVEPDAQWYETAHHELGHIYYYLTYSNPDVPLLLRGGANRAYHEAMGSLIGLAATQKPFLAGRGLIPQDIPKDTQEDKINILLKEALNHVVYIEFAAGTMPRFEYELYNKNLPKDQYNRRWWEIVKAYQGIVPPTPRGEEYCDACTKTHINDDPAQYYDYALSVILLFQLHDHIATKILKQDPHATNYYGNKEVGDFLRDLMRPGSSRDWRILLKEKTGAQLSASAMVKYFQPLIDHLKKVNSGRKYTLAQLN